MGLNVCCQIRQCLSFPRFTTILDNFVLSQNKGCEFEVSGTLQDCNLCDYGFVRNIDESDVSKIIGIKRTVKNRNVHGNEMRTQLPGIRPNRNE